MLKHFKMVFAGVLLLLLSNNASAVEDPIYTSFFSNSAAGGFDVVAYFTESQPIEGTEEFRTEYMGADWLFSSQENLNAFLDNPQKYAPQYGGYCAWAVSQNKLYKGDPLQWTVLNDKLYLNFDAEVQERWSKNREFFIVEADNRWPEVLK